MANCSAGDQSALESVFVQLSGDAGMIAAWLLFLAPIPTCRKISRRGYVGDFSALPYLVSTLQCGLWSMYALPWVTPDKTQPLVTNVVGFAIEMTCAPLLFAAGASLEALAAVFLPF